jgi:hypothetical protein
VVINWQKDKYNKEIGPGSVRKFTVDDRVAPKSAVRWGAGKRRTSNQKSRWGKGPITLESVPMLYESILKQARRSRGDEFVASDKHFLEPCSGGDRANIVPPNTSCGTPEEPEDPNSDPEKVTAESHKAAMSEDAARAGESAAQGASMDPWRREESLQCLALPFKGVIANLAAMVDLDRRIREFLSGEIET